MKTREKSAFVSVFIRESSSERLQPFKGITMNNVTCCSSQDNDSVNDKVFTLFERIDAFQSRRKFLESLMPKLDSIMGWYDDLYRTLKGMGKDIEKRNDRFTGSERENIEISQDIASLLERWETFGKMNQGIDEILKTQEEELQQVDEWIQTNKEAVVKLIETEFEKSQNSEMINDTLRTYKKKLQQLYEGAQTEKDKVVRLTETHNVRESRE